MRICVLTDENPADFNPAPFLGGFDWEMVTLTDPLKAKVSELKARGEFDLFLNLCEGFEPGEEYEYQGIDVVRTLEELNMPFTGAPSRFFDPTREEMQSLADAHGIGFAKGYRVGSVGEAEELAGNLRYPIMVKHPKSYGSTGMFKDSKATTPDQLRVQVARVCGEFGAARMEEFIEGKEYNVLVVDNPDDLEYPIGYPPAELIFPPGEEFWHTDIKWDYEVPFDFKEVTEPGLLGRLHDIAIRMFKTMGGLTYGRCDIRMNAQGELFILEINPNPAIMLQPKEYGPADYMILYDSGGYKLFFDRIFTAALMRHQARQSTEG